MSQFNLNLLFLLDKDGDRITVITSADLQLIDPAIEKIYIEASLLKAPPMIEPAKSESNETENGPNGNKKPCSYISCIKCGRNINNKCKDCLNEKNNNSVSIICLKCFSLITIFITLIHFIIFSVGTNLQGGQ